MNENKIKKMRLGIPQAMLYHTYAPFIDELAAGLSIETVYSGQTDRETLAAGIRHCADDACLPIKVLCGHIKKLEACSDYIALPRIMSCEYGQSMCPKINGLPELMYNACEDKNKLIFTGRLNLTERKFSHRLYSDFKRAGVKKKEFKLAYRHACEVWTQKGEPRLCETGYGKTVYLAGHMYNIADRFTNMNLVKKLHNMDIGVITSGAVPRAYKETACRNLVKKPFWRNIEEIYGAERFLEENGLIDGIICLSSFSCGTDSVTAEMIRAAAELPVLVLKVDEQTGEAGFDTRLEAYREVLFA